MISLAVFLFNGGGNLQIWAKTKLKAQLKLAPLLGVKIDKKLNFKSHTEEMCRKGDYKLHALQRIRKYLTVEKVKLLNNAFIICISIIVLRYILSNVKAWFPL